MGNTKKWSLSENIRGKISGEEAEFVLSQAEKSFSDTIVINDSLVSRSTNLLLIVISVITAIIGFSVNKIVDIQKLQNAWMIYYSFVCVGILLVPLILLVLNIKSHKYYHLGTSPDLLCNEELFNYDFGADDKKRRIYLYIAEIESAKHREQINSQINKKRWLMYNVSLYFVIGQTVITTIVSICAMLVI